MIYSYIHRTTQVTIISEQLNQNCPSIWSNKLVVTTKTIVTTIPSKKSEADCLVLSRGGLRCKAAGAIAPQHFEKAHWTFWILAQLAPLKKKGFAPTILSNSKKILV